MVGLAALPGLCEWVSDIPEGLLTSEFGEEAGGAARAVAIGQPRPGHSVLGHGTFTAAAPAWEQLAERYVDYIAALNAEGAGGGAGSEVALFVEGGGERVGIASMQDSSPEGLAGSGGAMAVFSFPAQEIIDVRS